MNIKNLANRLGKEVGSSVGRAKNIKQSLKEAGGEFLNSYKNTTESSRRSHWEMCECTGGKGRAACYYYCRDDGSCPGHVEYVCNECKHIYHTLNHECPHNHP